MAIFDRAPVVAKVYPVALVDDGYGGTKPGWVRPLTCRCGHSPWRLTTLTAGPPRAVQDPGQVTTG